MSNTPTAAAKPVVKTDEAVATIQTLIEQYKPHMARLLGQHIDTERMFQIALLALGRQPKLKECTGASILGCVLEASRMRLQPGGGAGETWLVPFKNGHTGRMECQLIVDYRGLIKLMKRNAGVGAVIAEPVHENDVFDYGIKDGKLTAEWHTAKGEQGKIKGYFAATWDKEGSLTAIVYKTLDEIEKNHRAKSKAKDSGPWAKAGTGDYDGMCRKTVLRLTAKYNPFSDDDVHRAVALDEKAELGKAQDMALLVDPQAPATPEAEPEKTYAEPKMTPPVEATPPEDAHGFAEFKVGAVAKTEIAGKPVHVVRAEPGQAKFYTDDEAVAEYARKALKDNAKVRVQADEQGGNRWIRTIERA